MTTKSTSIVPIAEIKRAKHIESKFIHPKDQKNIRPVIKLAFNPIIKRNIKSGWEMFDFELDEPFGIYSDVKIKNIINKYANEYSHFYIKLHVTSDIPFFKGYITYTNFKNGKTIPVKREFDSLTDRKPLTKASIKYN